MGSTCSRDTEEMRKSINLSHLIDEQNQKDFKEEKSIIKMLLLGMFGCFLI
jgi:hypothetical protein